MGQVLNSITDIVEAAKRLFKGDARLTTWDAVERVLERIPDHQLAAIYRRSVQVYPWCKEALQSGGDDLVTAGIENLATIMRQDPQIRAADARRFQRPAQPRQPQGRRRRRRGRRG